MELTKNKLLIIFACILMVAKLQAQISTEERPISFSLNLELPTIPIILMPTVNVDSVKQVEAELGNTPRPFRFGYAIDVDIDLKRMGTFTQLPNGDKLWFLKIHSANAYSINLIYNNFRLSKGSKFFIYNEDKSMTFGGFTPELNNNMNNVFATDLVQGHTIILEYYEPSYSNDGIINISKVIHGYINTYSADFSPGYGTSSYCNIDINCPLGYGWENEKRAVVLQLTNDNSTFGTGCLINNTKQDCMPYILTASHCIFYIGTHILSTNLATSIFRFKYWRPDCDSGNPNPVYKSVIGATLMAHWDSTDFALLKLSQKPPLDYGVYYAGWDRRLMDAMKNMLLL